MHSDFVTHFRVPIFIICCCNNNDYRGGHFCYFAVCREQKVELKFTHFLIEKTDKSWFKELRKLKLIEHIPLPTNG